MVLVVDAAEVLQFARGIENEYFGSDRHAEFLSRGLRFSKKRNIVCPWHGWEFDIESGRHCGDPKYRLRPVDVKVRDNRVYVSIPPAA